MEQIILISGKWSFEKNRHVFLIDKAKGCRILRLDDKISYYDFLGIVYEDFGLDRQFHDVALSYMLSKKLLQRLPHDTPPVFVENTRQLCGFFDQLKEDPIRLCVEIKDKNTEDIIISDEIDVSADRINSTKGSKEDEEVEEVEEDEEVEEVEADEEVEIDQEAEEYQAVEEDEEEDLSSRYDACDDLDGASSDDEEYGSRGKVKDCGSSDEEEMKNLPAKKRRAIFPEFVNLEISSLDLAIGQCYQTKKKLEMRLKILSITQKFNYDVGYSTPTLLTVKCWVEGCEWRVRASTVGDSTIFHVKSYVRTHTCSVTVQSLHTRHASYDILGRLYKDFIGGVGPTVLPNHVSESLTKRFGLKVDYWKAHHALRYARELVCGTPESGYEELPAYLYMIRRANPGTLIKLEVDQQDKFKFLFLAFGASIHGFQYMRKVVVVDETFLHGKYKGTLLLATTQDGNFNIFPLAFAVVDTENEESWEWFFRQLHRVIPDDEGLAIISDRHKAIGKATGKVYSLANRGICTYHLHKNILLKFKGGETSRLVKKAATAYTPIEFNAYYAEIQATHPGLYNYLQKADVCKWSRAHFQGDRYNFTTSNIAESVNRVLSGARSKPIVRLLEDIRMLLTRWFAKRRRNASVMQTALTTGIVSLLQARVEDAKQLGVQEIDDHRTQVTLGTTLHVVNLTDKTCTCHRFDLDKIPCVHAIAAAEALKRIHNSGPHPSTISLSHPYYHTNYLYNAYSNTFMPRDIALPFPDDVATKICLPPMVRNPPGRPKKKKIKGAFEIAMQKKRARKEHKCSQCHQPGHNRATCTG